MVSVLVTMMILPSDGISSHSSRRTTVAKFLQTNPEVMLAVSGNSVAGKVHARSIRRGTPGSQHVRVCCHAKGKEATGYPELQQLERFALAAAAAATLGAMSVFAMPSPALAVPQTSACATEACDGYDYSNRDLRKEFYTKGSLKGANFSGSNLTNVSLFGANLENANFTGSDLSLANLGQANLQGANLTQANLSGAIMSSARFDQSTVIDGADFTDVIVRKDINETLCKIAKGVNSKTNIPTAESLMCPGSS